MSQWLCLLTEHFIFGEQLGGFGKCARGWPSQLQGQDHAHSLSVVCILLAVAYDYYSVQFNCVHRIIWTSVINKVIYMDMCLTNCNDIAFLNYITGQRKSLLKCIFIFLFLMWVYCEFALHRSCCSITWVSECMRVCVCVHACVCLLWCMGFMHHHVLSKETED